MVMTRTSLARPIAGLIALVGIVGLSVQLPVSIAYQGSVGAALWGMARYYTNIGNAGVALILACFALGLSFARRPAVIGGATINAALIGIVYRLLLAGASIPASRRSP